MKKNNVIERNEKIIDFIFENWDKMTYKEMEEKLKIKKGKLHNTINLLKLAGCEIPRKNTVKGSWRILAEKYQDKAKELN